MSLIHSNMNSHVSRPLASYYQLDKFRKQLQGLTLNLKLTPNKKLPYSPMGVTRLIQSSPLYLMKIPIWSSFRIPYHYRFSMGNFKNSPYTYTISGVFHSEERMANFHNRTRGHQTKHSHSLLWDSVIHRIQSTGVISLTIWNQTFCRMGLNIKQKPPQEQISTPTFKFTMNFDLSQMI